MNTTPIVDAGVIRGGSPIEQEFALRWATIPKAPALYREVKFSGRSGKRNWRWDFANPEAFVAIELDGGLRLGSRGGHTSAAGAARDREKDFEAALCNWLVFRLTPDMAKDRERLHAIAAAIERRRDAYRVPELTTTTTSQPGTPS